MIRVNNGDIELLNYYKKTKKVLKQVNSKFEQINVKDNLQNKMEKMSKILENPNFDSGLSIDSLELNKTYKELSVFKIIPNIYNKEKEKLDFNLFEMESAKLKLARLQQLKEEYLTYKESKYNLSRDLKLCQMLEDVTNLKNKDEKPKSSSEKEVKYVDNIKDKEDTWFHFYKYNYKTNCNERISYSEEMIDIDRRMKNSENFFNRINDTLKSDKQMATRFDSLKENILYEAQYISSERNWCEDLLGELNNVRRLSSLDLQLKNKLQNYLSNLNERAKKVEATALNIDKTFEANKEKYDEILKQDIENGISDLYVDRISVNSNKNFDKLKIFEKFIVLNEKISRITWDSKTKEKYSKVLQDIHDKLQESLESEINKTSNPEQTKFDVKSLRDMSEGDIKKFADNPAAISKLCKMITSGKYNDGSKEIELSSQEKIMLGCFLKDVYEYRLEKEGLVEIKIEENTEGNTYSQSKTVSAKDKNIKFNPKDIKISMKISNIKSEAERGE